MANKKSIGLPGGPNEYITHVSQAFSTEGYKRNSPDVNNPYNIIPSSNITMEGVDFPVRGYGNNGIVQDMKPGGNYNYGDADYVFEVPLAKYGGSALPKAQRGYAVKPESKEQTPEEKYYNPEVEEDITTGDWKQDFLYNNQWLMDAPLIGDYIKNKARQVAEQSAGERRTKYDLEILDDPDSMYNQREDKSASYSGWRSIRDHANNKDQTSLMDQYFSEEALFPISPYKPTSDYLEFLPSYSIKGRMDEDRAGDQGYKDRLNSGLEMTIRHAFKKFIGQDGTDNEYTFEDITKSKEFTEFLKNKKTIFMTNDGDDDNRENDYLSDALGLDLGGHKTGIAWDEELNLPYISISDAWDFSPNHYSEKWAGDEEERQTAKIQSSLMHKAGHPFKIYDRFYFDPESQTSGIKYYTDKEIEQIKGEKNSKNDSPLPKRQNGNGEYKVASGDTFYGIANKNKIPWNALKEANPDLDYENLKLGQQLVLPNKIDRSPPMPKTGVSKNSNVLDYNALSNYLVDTRGGTVDTWGQLADTIAFHESSPWSRMDPKAKQYKGGPGRGLFQFEGESFDTALKRYKNVADAQGFTIKDSIVNAKSADELSSKDQYALFLANLIESKTKLSDFVDGNISTLDVWLTGHKNVEADGDRDSFLESKKAAEKEGIKNGYKTFQEGGEKYIVSSGDNLGKIANKYKTSVDELVRLNDISDPNMININQELVVPKIAQDSTLNKYTVKSGDTLGKLATKYNTSVTQLAKLNNIQDVNKINVNQELILPDSYREEKPVKEESWYNVDDIQKNNDKVNKLTDENIIINSQLLNNPNQAYVVIDKKTQRLKLYRGDEVDLDFEVLTGANNGDAQTVTNVIDYNKDGITTAADKREGKYKTDWMAGNRSTGAGIYTINQSAPTSEDRYQNAPSFNLLNESGIQVGTSIHGTPGFRNQYFDDGNLENNSASNGCINGKCSDLQALYNMNLPTGTPVFILPEDEGNSFQQVDGKAVMRMSNDNRKDYLEYTDLRGDKQEGQGGNYTTSTLSYKPIRAKLDKKLFQEKVYSAFDFNDDEEFNNTTQPFISALEKNKKEIMQAAQIPGDVYNQIAKIAFGIYGTESNFGDTHSGLGNLGRAANKYFDRQGSSSPDVISKYNTYDVQGDSNSVGYTQIRWSQLNDKEKTALESFDITSNKDFLNPQKSAIATATILGIRYNEQLTADQKKDVWKNLPSKWNNRPNYSSRVKSNSRYLQFEQLDKLKHGGEIENHIMYKNYVNGIYDGSKMESKGEQTYDKLNRVHYKDAKKSGMTVPNYIMSKVIKQSDN